MKATVPRELECVSDADQAQLLIHPLRRQILEHALEPTSSGEIAERLGISRQKIHYHVKELAKARLLRRAGRRRKRNLVEQRYVATAHSYVLVPEVLGSLRADRRPVEDRLSVAALLSLACRVQTELATADAEATAAGKRLSTLSLQSQLRFESPEQRAAFKDALFAAVADVVGRFSSPFQSEEGAGTGRPYRLVLGCYPIAPEFENPSPSDPRKDRDDDQGTDREEALGG